MQIKLKKQCMSNRITTLYSEYNTECYLEENVQWESNPVLVTPQKSNNYYGRAGCILVWLIRNMVKLVNSQKDFKIIFWKIKF